MTGGPRITLNNGVDIPALGFGTYQSKDDTAKRAVLDALEAGYRHIDTAWAYGNEREIGEAVRESGIKRGEIFITSKLWVDFEGYDEALDACRRGLDNMGVDHFDLYLIHWPVVDKWQPSWRALLRLEEEGLCRSVGVSNFKPALLRELMGFSGVAPAVNQVEFTPFLYDRELLDACTAIGTKVECFSPLTRGKRFDDPVLAGISRKYGKSPAQILIRWGLEHGLITLPKAATPERIRENIDVFGFSIEPGDMAALDGLNDGFSIVNPEWSGRFDGFGANAR